MINIIIAICIYIICIAFAYTCLSKPCYTWAKVITVIFAPIFTIWIFGQFSAYLFVATTKYFQNKNLID